MKRIFSKEFYQASIKEFTKVKSIVLMSIFVALMTVVGGIFSLNPLKIADRTVSLIFLFWPVIGILFGPIAGLFIAVLVDVLMYFIFPTGYPFYVGYTIAEMAVTFISGLFFYKSNVTILKIILFEFILDIGIHVCVESFFMNDIMAWNLGEAFKTYVIGGFIKNIVLWPIETIILVLLLSALLPVFHDLKLIDENINKKVLFFNKKADKEKKLNPKKENIFDTIFDTEEDQSNDNF